MSNYIAILGTQAFHNQWSSSDSKLVDIREWCEDVWANEISPNGNYGASFADWSEGAIAVPDSAFEDDNIDDLSIRRDNANDWLRDYWQYYDNYVAIIVIDDWGQDDDKLGIALNSQAGSCCNRAAIVDARADRNGNLPSNLENVGSEGIAAHELVHLYGAQHTDGSTQDGGWFNPDEASIIAVPSDPIGCADNGSLDEIISWYSDCTVNEVQDHIDSEDSIEPL